MDHATIRRFTEPPSPEILQRVARELYEIEPLRCGDIVVAWDSPLLSENARAKCALYAGTIIASWQRIITESS
jgi:hypothetical protein